MRAYQQLGQEHHPNVLDVERSKLLMIESCESLLRTKLHFFMNLNVPEPIQNELLFSTYYQTELYYLLMILGLILNNIKAYASVSALISVIPGLVQPAKVILTIIFVFLQAIFFYGFEISMLKVSFGLPVSNTDIYLLLDVSLDQLQSTTRINKLVAFLVVVVEEDQRQELIELIQILNVDISNKKNTIQIQNNSFSTKFLMYASIALGMITSIASSYFVCSMIMNTFAASLVSTPIGYLLIILAILVDLGFYYALGVVGMMRWINQDLNKFNTFQRKVAIFEQEYSPGFWMAIKKQNNRRQLNDSKNAETQTTYPEFNQLSCIS